MDLNQIVLIGRLVRDPELRKTSNNVSVAAFTLAVDRPKAANGETKTDFIDCIAWRQTAEFLCGYFGKGERCAVSGRLDICVWKDKNGNNRKTAEVIVENAYFCEKKSRGNTSETMPALENPSPGFEELEEDDGDLPF